MGDRLILIVDDDPLGRELLEAVLDANSFQRLSATNGREGFEMARAHRPTVVLMDINMPEVDGYEALARMRGRVTFR